MKQTASIDKIISSVGYAFEMYISEFSGMSDFNEEEVKQERKEAIDFIKSQQEKIEQLQQKWIPVSERLPEEKETIFAKLKGTDKWRSAMFEKMSDDV